ncbi:MAG TPA: argininosuccinate synthase [Candidatus Baltobacteraceae bacterium]
MARVILAYSGGLDTSVLLKKMILEGHEVVALTLDLGESDGTAGQGAWAVLEAVKAKALALGAFGAELVDAKERFISDYALPALAANAKYQNVYPLSAALSRPLIGALLVETAQKYGAQVVAHGCTGKGNDQVRIELAVHSFAPDLQVRAPLRESPLSRPDAIAFAALNGVPVSHTAAKPYSIDANLWGRSIESGLLEDLWNAPPEDAYAWTASPHDRPAKADELLVRFEDGVPSIDGATGARMVADANAIAGRHGVGRIDMVEDRVVGLKSREVYECPGSVTLIAAREALERLVLTRDELRFKATCDRTYAQLVYDGLWTSPLRDALDAFNASSSGRMTGDVRVSLHQAVATVTGVRSPFALYDASLATYGNEDAFDHRAADGFIRLHGLQIDVAARVAHKTSKAGV